MKPNITFEEINRLDLILKILKKVNAKSYLEIGCDKDQIFRHINCEKKVGVDPLRGGSLRMSSDEYFKNYKDTFDVIFIDGLHHYEQVTRDVNHAVDRLNPKGVIIIHDMLPVHEDETSMPSPIKSSHTRYWLGDVWRLSFDLIGRSDITFKLIAMDCGCGIVTKNPQVPNFVQHENDWEWYCRNIEKLPFVKYNEV